jgi:hypothetical protein
MSRDYAFRAQARQDVLAQQDWYMEQSAFDIAERL